MIAYNPKAWFTFIFRFHKADTLRTLLPTIVGISIYTLLITYLEKNIFNIEKTSHINNISVVHTLLGFVISMLLVFRTNTAYERWWDGRKLWGQLLNCSRNLAVKVAATEISTEFKDIKNVIIAFAFSLKNHLRNQSHSNNEELNNVVANYMLNTDEHVPMQISLVIYKKINTLHATGKISNEQVLLLNAEAQQWMDICGGCERIKNTPIPFSYSVFIKKFIFFYVMTLPIAMSYSLGYYSVPVVIFIFYVLASLELIAEEIENPFGSDANDLPIDEICKNIRKSINTVL